MKQLTQLTLLLILLSGCAFLKTTDPETLAYQTIGTVAHTVDAAMNGWGDWVRAGKATTGDEEKVKAAYDGYRAAMTATRESVQAFRAGTDQSALNASLTALQAAGGAVVAIISATKGTR